MISPEEENTVPDSPMNRGTDKANYFMPKTNHFSYFSLVNTYDMMPCNVMQCSAVQLQFPFSNFSEALKQVFFNFFNKFIVFNVALINSFVCLLDYFDCSL